MYKYRFCIGSRLCAVRKMSTVIRLKNLSSWIKFKWLLFQLQQIDLNIQLIMSAIRSSFVGQKSAMASVQRIQFPVHCETTKGTDYWQKNSRTNEHYPSDQSPKLKASIIHNLWNMKKHSGAKWSESRELNQGRSFMLSSLYAFAFSMVFMASSKDFCVQNKITKV